jgi:hypothetical protein
VSRLRRALAAALPSGTGAALRQVKRNTARSR